MVYNYLLGSSQPPSNCFESVMDVWSKEDEKFKKIYGHDVSECVCVCVCVCIYDSIGLTHFPPRLNTVLAMGSQLPTEEFK